MPSPGADPSPPREALVHPSPTTSTTGAAGCPHDDETAAPAGERAQDDAEAEARRRQLADAWPEVAFASG